MATMWQTRPVHACKRVLQPCLWSELPMMKDNAAVVFVHASVVSVKAALRGDPV